MAPQKISSPYPEIKYRLPVVYDGHGTPIPQNFTKHLAVSELDDDAFDRWLYDHYQHMDEVHMDESCQEVL